MVMRIVKGKKDNLHMSKGNTISTQCLYFAVHAIAARSTPPSPSPSPRITTSSHPFGWEKQLLLFNRHTFSAPGAPVFTVGKKKRARLAMQKGIGKKETSVEFFCFLNSFSLTLWFYRLIV
jgi:hypothetical protein